VPSIGPSSAVTGAIRYSPAGAREHNGKIPAIMQIEVRGCSALWNAGRSPARLRWSPPRTGLSTATRPASQTWPIRKDVGGGAGEASMRLRLAQTVLAVTSALIPFMLAHSIERPDSDFAGRIAAIEKQTEGRLGIAALDTASGRRVAYRSEERFAMCSTFKFLLAAAVLARVDDGKESLDRRVPYGAADLLDYAPITKAHLPEGGMTVSGLCAAAIQHSDNTAANLLLEGIGGPKALTRYARSLGDAVTRLDRVEPDLNANVPGDVRDTTTPAAMLKTMTALLTGDALSSASRSQLERWMIGATTGAARLRAGLPADWSVGDKTGTGENGAVNDIAIARPPNRAAVLIAVFLTDSSLPMSESNAALADVGRTVASEFKRSRLSGKPGGLIHEPLKAVGASR